MCRILLVMWLLIGLRTVQAQSIITAEQIEQLQSVQQIDFEALPPAVGEIANGQFFTNENGTILAIVNQQGQIVILDDTGVVITITDVILTEDDFPATFIDGAFGIDRFVSVHSIGNGYVITNVDLPGELDRLIVKSSDKPVAIWATTSAIWLEVIPGEPSMPPYLSRFTDEGQAIKPFAPATVDNIVVRIGRLAPPIVVTVTEDRVVQRWNLETGEQIGQSYTDAMPLYGHMLPGSDQMVWRDPASTALHLLNFLTGEDRIIASLNESYIPFLFLNIQADVILGVNVDDEPVVAAWMVDTGSRLPLGLYRQCNRPPDMVRLSADSTTLIIGCDTGLDIWRNLG